MENKISVIVPVYNVEDYLNRCVDSIINQTHKNLEIILVNDGSVDDSRKICDDYASKDNRVIVIHKENEGSSCARNAGLDIATGEYVSFVDSDDYIYDSMLQKMLDKLVKNKLDVIEIAPASKNNTTKSYNNFIIEDKISAFKRVIKSTTFSVWCRLYKASLIKDLRFIPKIIHQDVFFTIDVLNRVEKLGYLNSELYYYNTSNESIIRSKYSQNKIEIGIMATEYIANNIPKNPELTTTINNYITSYYTDHFFLLSRNTEVDPDQHYRRKLKKAVWSSTTLYSAGLRPFMILVLPIKLMEIISSRYNSYSSK
ncbi:glycosyltransferase [Winogradskyella bathintestinalis]|uniref:Glycosyltransferase n=1 Tax=Winogradskyella bathintestinalis TaxID=3035208 RepID=A0ABT7ZXL7_9FLAO|nr:glycosyltransferase [Winogradskyella bathintestinalis]MDN3493746.1 glycosyltransferase [Winogradskyella bathintestinalis]